MGMGQFQLSLLMEIVRELWRRILAPLRTFWRRTWFYRTLLKGRMPDRIVFHPYDARPRHLEDADSLLRGRFNFAGHSVEAGEGSIFDKSPPSPAWHEALNEFVWLPPLSAAGGEAARKLGTNLVAQWVKRNVRYSEPAWSSEVLARRLVNVFGHGRFVLANSDVLWRSRLLVSLREQCRMLERIADSTPQGFARIEAAAAYALSGACLADSPRRLAAGTTMLEAELAQQILPDGGHASRSPEMLLAAHNLLLMVSDALSSAGQPTPPALRNALDRMAPMLRFFRMGDGALALFNGGHQGDARMIEALLARDIVRGQPFAFAPYSGFHRLIAGRSTIIMDCGKVPEGVYATAAHAGCLSFEFSAGAQRIIVNCGAPPPWQAQWGSALRGTAAHSTVTLADRSMATVLSGWMASVLGPRLIGGPAEIKTNRRETPQGFLVEATHDGYLHPFGILHERRIALSMDGFSVGGSDRLAPRSDARRRGMGIPFAARFHIHPDVRVSPVQSGGILLKLPNGEGWRFQVKQYDISIEESVYLGGGEGARKTEQLVIGGTVGSDPVEINWSLQKIAMP
jgi:uncharacterized heparinase superfamily protein